MTSRRRASTYAPTVQGGGGGPSAAPTVQDGPTFGPGNANNAGVSAIEREALTLGPLALNGTLREREALTMPALAVRQNAQTVQEQLSLSLAVNEQTLVERLALSMPSLVLDTVALAEQEQLSFELLDLDYQDLVENAQLTGTALGAPFWQQVDTASDQQLGNIPSIDVTYSVVPPDGMFLLAFVTGNGSGVSPDTPAGWTSVGTTAASGNLKARVFSRVASGEGATQTFAYSGGTNTSATAEIHQILGGGGVDVFTQGNASIADPVIPAVTTTVVNCLVFYFLGHMHTLSQSHTPPASNDERTEFETSGIGGVCSNSGTRIFAAAGATGTATVNCNQLGASGAAYHRVAVFPAPVTLL